MLRTEFGGRLDASAGKLEPPPGISSVECMEGDDMGKKKSGVCGREGGQMMGERMWGDWRGWGPWNVYEETNGGKLSDIETKDGKKERRSNSESITSNP